jgi:hypothetical protein
LTKEQKYFGITGYGKMKLLERLDSHLRRGHGSGKSEGKFLLCGSNDTRQCFKKRFQKVYLFIRQLAMKNIRFIVD